MAVGTRDRSGLGQPVPHGLAVEWPHVLAAQASLCVEEEAGGPAAHIIAPGNLLMLIDHHGIGQMVRHSKLAGAVERIASRGAPEHDDAPRAVCLSRLAQEGHLVDAGGALQAFRTRCT